MPPQHSLHLTRRNAIACVFGTLFTDAAWTATAPAAAMMAMEVWKDSHCGCCNDWIEVMQAAGFDVKVHQNGNTAVRAKLGLPVELGSCHTALVAGYVVEGHVPPADVRKLLQQRPKALGITVPGMPIGSPGMDGAVYQGRKDPFDVLLVSLPTQGKVHTEVFSSYR